MANIINDTKILFLPRDATQSAIAVELLWQVVRLSVCNVGGFTGL